MPLVDKCLFDKNVDSRRVTRYATTNGLCAQASGIIALGFDKRERDRTIVNFAVSDGWAIATKDGDYYRDHYPDRPDHPGLIWLNINNTTIDEQRAAVDAVVAEADRLGLANLDGMLAWVKNNGGAFPCTIATYP